MNKLGNNLTEIFVFIYIKKDRNSRYAISVFFIIILDLKMILPNQDSQEHSLSHLQVQLY